VFGGGFEQRVGDPLEELAVVNVSHLGLPTKNSNMKTRPAEA
jgi:hypothetical protein